MPVFDEKFKKRTTKQKHSNSYEFLAEMVSQRMLTPFLWWLLISRDFFLGFFLTKMLCLFTK